MSWRTERFDSYWFRIHAGDRDSAATVYLKDGQKLVASLLFMYNLNQTKAYTSTNGNRIILEYPAEQLHAILETMRQEKPLSIHYSDNQKWGYITSADEQVGEEEGGS
ncbi:MAG: hypothetical protein AAGF87_08285 [Bacteroidota bacterium]